MGIPTPFQWECQPPLPPPPGCFFRNRHCLHLEQAFETLLEEMKFDTDVLDDRNIRFTTWIGLFASIQLLVWIWPCCVVLQLYVFVKLSRNQSWVNLLFSVLQDLILDSIFSIACSWFLIRAGIKNRELHQESRLTTDYQLSFEWCCNCLNGWLTDETMFDWLTE